MNSAEWSKLHNLRPIEKNEAILEFDFLTKDESGPVFEQCQELAAENIRKLKEYFVNANASFYITSHGGKSDHLRLKIDGLQYYGSSYALQYKNIFLDNLLAKINFDGEGLINIDRGCINHNRLISIEGKPHYKAKYNGAIEKEIFRHEGNIIPIDIGLMDKVIESSKKDNELNVQKIDIEDVNKKKLISFWKKYYTAGVRNKLILALGGMCVRSGLNLEESSGLLHELLEIVSEANAFEERIDQFKYSFDMGPEEVAVYYHIKDAYPGHEYEVYQELLSCFKNELDSNDVVTLKHIFDVGFPPLKWRVQDLVPERGITMLGGASGCYKTWAAMQIVLSVSSGNHFLEVFETSKCNVLYVDEENGEVCLPNRFKMLSQGDYCFDNIFISIFKGIKLDSDESIEFLKKTIIKHNIRLVVIDSMVRCMNGEEDKSKDVRVLFENLKSIFKNYSDLAFLILHHTTKSGKGINSLRGSGDFIAAAESILMFEKKRPGSVMVEIGKARHISEEDNKFGISFDGSPESMFLEYKELHKNTNTLKEKCADKTICYLHENNLSEFKSGELKEVMEDKGYKNNTFYAGLRILVDLGKIKQESKGKYSVIRGDSMSK
ncbi:AAA family ATPase [archaeon]|jgi:hypothetical protein|nr:AAA family ATPase [archaeon]MBT7192663.1 AAA family ATPase [archaeon]MBT7297845.1 AAA family ATPase [archaeon]